MKRRLFNLAAENLIPSDARYHAAMVEYARLRRRWWRFFLLAIGFAVLGAPVFFVDRAEGYVRWLAVVGNVLSGGFVIAACVSWFALLKWPCPRCGKRFILGVNDSLPTDECKHCGLNLAAQG